MDQQDNKLTIHDNIWHFSVTDPQLHKKNFTIYKVICKTFPIKSPESLTEIICWKRYNDFKTLCKSLLALHKALHRRDPFPEFAKPKLFGRFDDTVIEERRQSALNLLNFISGQPHLYKSVIFRQFIDDGKSKSSQRDNKQAPFVLRSSSTLDVLSGESSQSDGKPPPDLVPIIIHKDKAGASVDADLSPDLTMNKKAESFNGQRLSEKRNPADYKVSEVTGLDGTWNYPQVADNISLGSSTGDETVDTDEDSVMAQSLPDTELAYFDPIAGQATRRASEPHMTTSNSWLFAGLNICAEMDGVLDETDAGVRKTCRAQTDTSNSSTLVCHSFKSSTIEVDAVQEVSEPRPFDELEEFDPLPKMSESSSVECGKGDLDLSGQWDPTRSNSFSSQISTSSQRTLVSNPLDIIKKKIETGMKSQASSSSRTQSFGSDRSQEVDGVDKNNSTPTHTAKGLLQKLISKSPSRRPRSSTEQSVSTMDLGGKEDYIYLAASQISMAQNSEANGDFEVAFAYYKSGVGILLQGVQSDSNKSRRDAVRRKTAQYLMKAEDLFNRHLASEDVNERRWGVDSFLSPSLDLDPSLAFIRGSVKDLRNFQVLGVVDKVILIRDKATDETFVVKSIRKSPAADNNRSPSILPTSCPFMVSLHKFYETDSAIYLLLQYASGGKLWTYIGDYLSGERSVPAAGGGLHHFGTEKEESQNIYSGCKIETDGSDSTTEISPVKKNNHQSDETEVCLSRIMSKEAARQDDDDEPKSQTVGSSNTVGVVRFSNVKKTDDGGESDDNVYAEGRSRVRSMDRQLSSVSDNETDKGLDDRRISSFSDDSSHLFDTENSLLSQSSLLQEEDHFQTLLQEHRSNLEGFSINSFDSEDNRRLNSVNFERIDSIAEDQEPQTNNSQSVEEGMNVHNVEFIEVSKQTNEDDVFVPSEGVDKLYAPTFNSDDIVKNSKELLKEVDKVLYEADSSKKIGCSVEKKSNSSQDSTVDNPNSVASSEMEEPSIYDTQRYSGDSSDLSPSDKKPNNVSPDFKYPNKSKLEENSTPGSTEAEPTASSIRPRLNSVNAVFRQTSTPHKLSLSRMNSKEMTRSASFECDIRSPSRNKARIVTDLFERLDSTSQEQVRLPESSVRKWIANIVTAVSRLHSLGIICRDLSPKNVLLAEGGAVYLTYFCHLGQGDQGLDWSAVNDMYTAPEVRSIGGYNMTCDWWSIGALLYELVVGRSVDECHPGGINSHTCLHIPSFVSTEARGLLEALLTYNPKERLGSGMAGSEEIKAHPFFNGVDWHALESS